MGEWCRRHERSGRSLGSERVITRLERLLCRILHPQKPGPKGPRQTSRRARNQIWCPEWRPLPRAEGWGEGAWLAADEAGGTLTRPPLAGDLSPRERWATLRRDTKHAPRGAWERAFDTQAPPAPARLWRATSPQGRGGQPSDATPSTHHAERGNGHSTPKPHLSVKPRRRGAQARSRSSARCFMRLATGTRRGHLSVHLPQAWHWAASSVTCRLRRSSCSSPAGRPKIWLSW